MHHAEQTFGETGFDAGEFGDGEIAFVELAVGDAVLDDGGDEALNAGGVRLVKAAGRAFDGVGKGDDGGFLELGARAGVAEDVLGNLRDVVFLGFGFTGLFEQFRTLIEGAFVEVIGQGRAVVLLDDIKDLAVEVVFDAQIDTVFDVSDEDKRAHAGREVIVGILPGGHVFDEVLGFGELANVMKIGADAAEGGAGADGFCGSLGQTGDHQAVVISAGGFDAEATHQRVIEVGEFQPGDVCGDPG